MTIKIVQLIFSNTLLVGAGTKEDPARRVLQLFSPGGKLVAEFDPIGEAADDPEDRKPSSYWTGETAGDGS